MQTVEPIIDGITNDSPKELRELLDRTCEMLRQHGLIDEKTRLRVLAWIGWYAFIEASNEMLERIYPRANVEVQMGRTRVSTAWFMDTPDATVTAYSPAAALLLLLATALKRDGRCVSAPEAAAS